MNVELNNICGLCRGPMQSERQPGADEVYFDCVRCGRYSLTGSVFHFVLELPDRARAILAIITRKATRTEQFPKRIDSHNVRRLIDEYQQPDVARRRQLVIDYLGRQSSDIGDRVPLSKADWYPFFECTSEQALELIYDSLAKSGEIEAGYLSGSVTLTTSGWQAVQGARGGVPGTCFIAMCFTPDLDPALAAMERAVDACRLRPLRVDKVEHNKNINDFVLTQIRRAEVLIADFTFQRQNVYYEAGFASALGREVVHACRKDYFDKTHFDTRAINHIVWDTEEDLEQRLEARLRNTVPSLIGRSR